MNNNYSHWMTSYVNHYELLEPIKNLSLSEGLDLLSQDFEYFITKQIPVWTRSPGSEIRLLFETILPVRNFNEYTNVHQREQKLYYIHISTWLFIRRRFHYKLVKNRIKFVVFRDEQ